MKKYVNNQQKAPDIGIATKDLAISAEILNKLLADETVLLFKTLNYHWNLIGPEFRDYHLLFDAQYKAIFDHLDDIAERIRAVGGIATTSLTELKQEARLQEDLGDIPTTKMVIVNLLKDHESVIQSLRENINQTAMDNRDMGTNNFLTDLLEKHEKMAWMLRSLS